MDDLEDVDTRPGLFLGLTPENLARHVSQYSRTASTPSRVAGLLAEARRTFVGAATCYDNLASAAFKGLEAAETGSPPAPGKGRVASDARAAASKQRCGDGSRFAAPRVVPGVRPSFPEPAGTSRSVDRNDSWHGRVLPALGPRRRGWDVPGRVARSATSTAPRSPSRESVPATPPGVA